MDAFSRKGTQSHAPMNMMKVSRSSMSGTFSPQFGALCSRGSAVLMWTSLPIYTANHFKLPWFGHPHNMSGCIHSGLVMAFSVLLPTNCNDSDGKGESVPGIHEFPSPTGDPSVVLPVVVPSVARSSKYRNWPVYHSAPAAPSDLVKRLPRSLFRLF